MWPAQRKAPIIFHFYLQMALKELDAVDGAMGWRPASDTMGIKTEWRVAEDRQASGANARRLVAGSSDRPRCCPPLLCAVRVRDRSLAALETKAG